MSLLDQIRDVKSHRRLRNASARVLKKPKATAAEQSEVKSMSSLMESLRSVVAPDSDEESSADDWTTDSDFDD